MNAFFRLLILAALPVLFTGCIDSQQSSSGESATKELPDTAAISKLVEQLGSSVITERREAAKSLQAIGFSALDALRMAAKGNNAEVAREAARLIEVIEYGLDQLLTDYRGYGLPLPPDDAKLVRFESGGRFILNGELMPPTYSLGFLLRPATKDGPPLLLVGTQEVNPDSTMPFEVVDPKPELVKGLELYRDDEGTFDMNDGLIIALQCQARGWNALAKELWISSLKQFCGDHFGVFFQPANLPDRTAVAYLTWAHSGNELVKPESDRAKTAIRMKAVLAAEPTLDTEVSRALIESLEAALAPSAAKPGSVERLIDDLTEMCNTGRDHDDPDPRYTRLAEMGFAAVPALLEHLDDHRLTRSVKLHMNNFPTWNLRVADVVSDILQKLAGEDIGKDWLQRRKGWTVEKADAKAWWNKAQKDGEEAYVVHNVLPDDEQAEWPNSLMLNIITKKYPQQLPTLYKAILDQRPKLQCWPVAEAIARSSLPDDEKKKLFLYASRDKDLMRRRDGLSHLEKFDPDEFMAILLATLESLPATPKEPYWKCPEAAYVHLVMATDDDRAWKMLEKVAKRSDVGLRMEFMDPMNYSYIGERQRQRRLDFLALFLDDAAAPDYKADPMMYDGPHAGFDFRRLEVRDLAALKIAAILKMPDSPDLNWTPEQWQKLRDQVQEGLSKK